MVYLVYKELQEGLSDALQVRIARLWQQRVFILAWLGPGVGVGVGEGRGRGRGRRRGRGRGRGRYSPKISRCSAAYLTMAAASGTWLG